MAIGDGMLAQVLLDYFHQHAAILRTDFKQPCHQWCRSYKAPHRPTVCPSNDSSSVLSYQWFPTTIRSGETITRRRKEDSRVGIASRGPVERLGRFPSRVRLYGHP